MRVCAEALFALNLTIDAGLLCCSARLCGEHIRPARVIAAGALGGGYAVAALLPGAGFLQPAPIRFCVAGVMALVAFGKSRRFFRLSGMFLCCAAGFAGLVFAVVQAAGTGLLRLPGGGYYPVSALALGLCGGVCALVCGGIFSACAQHGPREFCSLQLTLGENRASCRALRDTGNTLKDPLTNESVLVASWAITARLLPEAALCAEDFRDAPGLMARLSRAQPQVRFRLIPYRAVGTSQGMLLAVRCEASKEGQKPRPVLVAFSPTELSSGGEYEALMGGAE